MHFLKRAGLSKVTLPRPKGGRNPFEASSLASCTAKPCHYTTAPAANAIPRNGRLRLPANRPYDCTTHPVCWASLRSAPTYHRCRLRLSLRSPTFTANSYCVPALLSPICVWPREITLYLPKNGSQSLNTGCNPACRTAAATSPTGRSSWMANCSSSSLSPSA